MDLALLLLLVGIALVLLTALNGLGYLLIAAAVVLIVFSAVSGRGTFYRSRR